MAKTELQNVWIALRASGLSYRKIARRIGVSAQTQVKWAKKFKDKIQTIKENELDFISEQLRLVKKHRIVRLSGLLEKLEDELEGRDISDMPTASLLRVYISIMQTIRNEVEIEQSIDESIGESLLPYLEIVSQIAKIER